MNPQTASTGQRLIAHFGGREKAARALDVVGETIRLWRINGIPLDRALEIETKTGGAIKAEEILQEARSREARPEEARAQ